jgi:hypothetical protein
VLLRRHFRKSRSFDVQLVGMVPETSTGFVIHNSVAWGMRRGCFEAGSPRVTLRVCDGIVAAAPASTEVTEFGYFEYCGLGSK